MPPRGGTNRNPVFGLRHLRWARTSRFKAFPALQPQDRPPTVFDNLPPAGDSPKSSDGPGRPGKTHAATDAGSTLTPAPMVLDTAMRRRYTPLEAAGLALTSASTSAPTFCCSASTGNDARPTVA